MNIHVNRYRESDHWHCSVAPEDRSWILFVPKDGDPTLMIEAECQDEDGRTLHGYVALTELPPNHEGLAQLT